MKSNQDIEKILGEWQSLYKLPVDYFADFHQKNLKEKKAAKILSIYSWQKKWQVAVSVILLLGVVLFFALQKTTSGISVTNGQVQNKGRDLFYGLSEDEIIEYLLDNEEYLDEL